MRTRIPNPLSRTGVAFLAMLAGACDLDLDNPNSPTEGDVLSTEDGVIAAAVGMQGIYAQAVEDIILVPALVTDEWGTQLRALISYRSLFDGQNFDAAFGVVEAPWAQAYRTVKAANTVLAAAGNVGFSPGTRGGIEATAELFKAMALGSIILQYERVPITVSSAAPAPQDRAVVLDTILALLEDARTKTAAMSPSEFATLRTRVLGTGFNLLRTIDAMRARYYLVDGQYQQAITAANAVKLDTLSVFAYLAADANPVYNLAFQLIYVAGLKSFVDAAEVGDLRPAYWLATATTPFVGNPDSLLYPLRKYGGRNDPFPVYLPDEMRLVKAEAFTRLAQLDSGAFYVNAVRTQAASPVDEPVAGLTALPATALDTEAELLAEIARQRRYELYMQGLRWEDSRRLGSAITTTPALTFPWGSYLPSPTQECRTNANAVNCM